MKNPKRQTRTISGYVMIAVNNRLRVEEDIEQKRETLSHIRQISAGRES